MFRRTALLLPLLVACADTASFDGKLGARFVDKSGQALTSVSQALTSIEGLYFGELEIVAYDYRPGESLQASGGFGNGNPSDWSYWVALQSGHDAGRDNVLTPGDQIDFTAMNGDYARPIEQDFIDEVGEFEMDFVEVYLHRTGVIVDGKYYGMNADLNGHESHPLHKYPQWSSIDDTFCMPLYPGFDGGQDLNVIFARSDWFPEAVSVVVSRNGSEAPVIESATPALSAEQEQKLLSLVEQGTMRRFYANLQIIPYAGPVTLDLTNGQTPPALPDGGQEEPDEALTSAGNVVNAKNVALSVNFNISDVLADETDLDASENGQPAPKVVYKGDASNVPFGLTLTFAPVVD